MVDYGLNIQQGNFEYDPMAAQGMMRQQRIKSQGQQLAEIPVQIANVFNNPQTEIFNRQSIYGKQSTLPLQVGTTFQSRQPYQYKLFREMNQTSIDLIANIMTSRGFAQDISNTIRNAGVSEVVERDGAIYVVMGAGVYGDGRQRVVPIDSKIGRRFLARRYKFLGSGKGSGATTNEQLQAKAAMRYAQRWNRLIGAYSGFLKSKTKDIEKVIANRDKAAIRKANLTPQQKRIIKYRALARKAAFNGQSIQGQLAQSALKGQELITSITKGLTENASIVDSFNTLDAADSNKLAGFLVPGPTFVSRQRALRQGVRSGIGLGGFNPENVKMSGIQEGKNIDEFELRKRLGEIEEETAQINPIQRGL